MKKLTYKFLIVLASSFVFWMCADEDDHFGDLGIQATAPSITIAVPTTSATFIEKDTTFEFTVTMSTPQLVDVYVYLTKTAGNATAGDDFAFDNRIIIPANRTSAKGAIKVSADDIPEGTETFTVQIGDARTANATVTPVTIAFTIMNVSEDDLPLEFSWSTSYFDANGNALAATAVADLILYITEPDGTILEEIDGGSFESFVVAGDYPDGDYLIKAGVYGVINPGGLGGPAVLDLSLAFSQLGVISATTFEFPQAMTGFVCSSNVITLASLNKSGTTYTLEQIGEYEFDLNNFTGAYDADEPGYGEYPVTFTVKSCNTITNSNFWDAGFLIDYVLNPNTGTVTIPNQTRNASAFGLGNIVISGSGTFDADTFTMVVDYKVVSAANPATVYDDNTHTFTKP